MCVASYEDHAPRSPRVFASRLHRLRRRNRGHRRGRHGPPRGRRPRGRRRAMGGAGTTDAGVDAAGDDGGGGGGGGDDGGTEAGGDSIWPADATKLVVESPGGGFTPQPPPGSDCNYGEAHYTLDRTTHAFTF